MHPRVTIDWRRKRILYPLAILILAVTGPFGTSEITSPLHRFVYWGTAVFGIGYIMNLAVYAMLTAPISPRVPPTLRAAVGVVLGAIPGSSIIFMIGAIFQGPSMIDQPFLLVYLAVLLVGSLITIVDMQSYIFVSDDAAENPPSPPVVVPKFLRRLKPEVGRKLVSLAMQDHYVEVVTEVGRDLILMRMSDAMKELEQFPGRQVHRSHWVARSQMQRLERKGSSYFLILRDGQKIPVSRGFLPAVRADLEELAASV